MWNLIVSVPDHCLSFYFTSYGQFSHSDLGRIHGAIILRTPKVDLLYVSCNVIKIKYSTLFKTKGQFHFVRTRKILDQ